jgi:hypothetical protein
MSLPDTNITSLTDSEHAAENVTSADDPMNRHACSTDAGAENVTSTKRPPMSPAERKRRERERKAAQQEHITYRSDEWRQFVDIGGLQRKAGASWRDLGAIVLRELADNAADAAGGDRAWIETVEIDGNTWWCIGDHGPGIAPEEVAYKFNVRRPMESTKLVRRPTRGMLGNGTRVVAGYCAIEDADLIVDSRGMRTTLRFEKSTGMTSVARQEPIADIVGTRVYLQQCRGLTQESVAELAQDTLALATLTDDARIYSGPSNPWWYGAADLARLMASAPDDKTIGDVVRDMSLALPRGMQDGKAAGVTEEQAKALLDELREKIPPVEPRRIGYVGKSAFNMPGYALKTTIRPLSWVRGHDAHALNL